MPFIVEAGFIVAVHDQGVAVDFTKDGVFVQPMTTTYIGNYTAEHGIREFSIKQEELQFILLPLLKHTIHFSEYHDRSRCFNIRLR